MIFRTRYFTVLTLLAFCILTGCSGQSNDQHVPTDKALQDVQLHLNWFPEAEHGGFYAALHHGFFKEEGLNVIITGGGPGKNPIPKVASGEYHFGISNADRLLTGWAAEAEVVGLMAPLQNSPRCIMVHADSGIEKLEDIKAMTLAMSSTASFSHYLQKKIPLTDVEIVPYPGNVAKFIVDKKFAQQAYVFSEPFVVKKDSGEAPKNLMVSDLGFNPYTSVLFTNKSMIEKNPELVEKMVRASLKGWKKYLAEPKETNEQITSLNETMGPEILAFGVEQLKPLCVPEGFDDSKFGTMTKERWETLLAQLIEAELLKAGEVQAENSFDNSFLEQVLSE